MKYLDLNLQPSSSPPTVIGESLSQRHTVHNSISSQQHNSMSSNGRATDTNGSWCPLGPVVPSPLRRPTVCDSPVPSRFFESDFTGRPIFSSPTSSLHLESPSRFYHPISLAPISSQPNQTVLILSQSPLSSMRYPLSTQPCP